MHSPGPDLGRSHGNNPVDISLSTGVVPPQGRDQQLYGFRRSSSSHGIYTRIALVTPATPAPAGTNPPGTGVTYPLEMSWEQGTPEGEPRFPRAGPPPQSEPVVPGHGDNVARLWRSLNSGGCRTAHHCSANHFFFCFFLSHVPCPISHNNESTLGPAECA